MTILDRIILTIYMLLMVLVSLVIVILPFNLVPLSYINLAVTELSTKWYYCIGGIVLLGISLKLLFSGVKSSSNSRGGIVKPSEFGDIKISTQTFESLSLRAVRQISGIKDVKVRVDIAPEGLTIYARLLVLPDINMTKIVTEVQGRMKEYVESITDMAVKEVRVDVENVAQIVVPRVS